MGLSEISVSCSMVVPEFILTSVSFFRKSEASAEPESYYMGAYAWFVLFHVFFLAEIYKVGSCYG